MIFNLDYNKEKISFFKFLISAFLKFLLLVISINYYYYKQEVNDSNTNFIYLEGTNNIFEFFEEFYQVKNFFLIKNRKFSMKVIKKKKKFFKFHTRKNSKQFL